MKSKKNRAILTALALIMTALLITAAAPPARASDYTNGPDPVEIARVLLDDPEQSVQVSATGMTTAEIKALYASVQAYVDAASVSSVTPPVTAAIGGNSDKTRFVRFRVRPVEDPGELDAGLVQEDMTVKEINDVICQSAQYDKEAARTGLKQESTPATAYGALIDGKAVCQGYANAFAMLAEPSGIQSIKLRGRLKSGVSHVTNMVMTKDGALVVDVTYNDALPGDKFLMITLDEYIKKTGFIPAIDVESAFELKYGTSGLD